jgi:hypothetical protein
MCLEKTTLVRSLVLIRLVQSLECNTKYNIHVRGMCYHFAFSRATARFHRPKTSSSRSSVSHSCALGAKYWKWCTIERPDFLMRAVAATCRST